MFMRLPLISALIGFLLAGCTHYIEPFGGSSAKLRLVSLPGNPTEIHLLEDQRCTGTLIAKLGLSVKDGANQGRSLHMPLSESMPRPATTELAVRANQPITAQFKAASGHGPQGADWSYATCSKSFVLTPKPDELYEAQLEQQAGGCQLNIFRIAHEKMVATCAVSRPMHKCLKPGVIDATALLSCDSLSTARDFPMLLIMEEGQYPCPCCGYIVFRHPPGSHQTCPICQWEDDLAQLRFPRMPGSANSVSLEDAQQNYADFGAAARRRAIEARTPLDDEAREHAWRRLDAARDNIEEPMRGVGYAESYPFDDPTVLYYWRGTYWRRFAS